MTNHVLEDWLIAEKRAGKRAPRGKLARAVDCSAPRITQIAKYGQKPALALAVTLSKATGIPVGKFVKEKQPEAAQ